MITFSQTIKPLTTLLVFSTITSLLQALLSKPLGWVRSKDSSEPDQNRVKPGNLTSNEPIGLIPYKDLIQSSPGKTLGTTWAAQPYYPWNNPLTGGIQDAY